MVKTNKKILIFLLSFLSGVFLAPDFIYLKNLIYILIFVFIILFFISRKSIVSIFCLFFIGIFFGFIIFLYSYSNVESKIINHPTNLDANIEGYISSYPQEKEKSVTFVLTTNGENIYVLLPKLDSYYYGQRLELTGKINKIQNEDEFNFKDYFLSKRISHQMFYPKVYVREGDDGNFIMRLLFGVRKIFEEKTNEIFVKPYSSFVLGILLGVKSLSSDLMDMFSKVSLSHIIVVSGYNLSIIAEVLKKIFYPTSRKLSFWVPISGIWIFTFLVGADAPVFRAAIMASVIVLSRKEGKKTDGLAILTLAASSMVIFNPFIIRYDPGFQLSFLSTLGIILYCERIEHFIKLPKTVSEIISATLAAQIFILPVIAFYFGRISVLGPIANFIVIPFVPVIMLISFITVLVGFINIELAILISNIAIFLILLCLKIGYFLSDVNFSFINIKFDIYSVILYFSTLLLINILIKNVKKKKI